MDGNRTHPGRLNSAPQTVLKTARLASASVHERPHEFVHKVPDSMPVRRRTQPFAGLAVFLAVTRRKAAGRKLGRIRTFDLLIQSNPRYP